MTFTNASLGRLIAAVFIAIGLVLSALSFAAAGTVSRSDDRLTPVAPQSVPVSAVEINCFTYATLHLTNPALFAGFDASQCQSGNGGSGGDNGGGNGGGATDVCPNIDGVQTEVPAGKVIVDGNCVDQSTGSGSRKCSYADNSALSS